MSKVNFRTSKIVVPIDKIMPNRWNPNVMEKSMFEKQKQSINELGFLGSILVRTVNHTTCDYEILDGEHRWKALKEAGATECPVESIGDIPDKEAQLLTILINNLHGKDDIFKRAKILEALDAGQLSLLPMTEQEIEHEKQFVQFDFGKYESVEEIPVRKNFLFLAMALNEDEAQVWIKCKEEMMKRGMISSKNKKQADIQALMIMMRQWIGITQGSNPEQAEFTIEL
jgi:hypothetical protein